MSTADPLDKAIETHGIEAGYIDQAYNLARQEFAGDTCAPRVLKLLADALAARPGEAGRCR
jgi:hypothetical protein